MRKLVFAAVLSAALLFGAQQANATSPCCAADSGQACNQDPADQLPDGAGCQEQDEGTCIGGMASADGVQGCVCVGGVCVSGGVPPKPVGTAKIGVEASPASAVLGEMGGSTATCTRNAVAGCAAAGEVHSAN